MKRVYSRADPSKLLYAICKSSDAKEYRTDIGPEEEFLQLSIRKLKKGTTVPAHKHLPISKTADITQELWVVISGVINGTFYDINNEELETVELVDGDCALLFRGGHKLEVVKEDTIFYEIKTGPYYGKIADKEPIE
jgi:cupin fold WbuC family metalloprotein